VNDIKSIMDKLGQQNLVFFNIRATLKEKACGIKTGSSD
jgi:hypothetical protein